MPNDILTKFNMIVGKQLANKSFHFLIREAFVL